MRALLAEAGRRRLGAAARGRAIVHPPVGHPRDLPRRRPRAERFLPANPDDGPHHYPGPGGRLPLNDFALGGTWNVSGQAATAVRDAIVDVEFQAAKVYLVLSSRGGLARSIHVSLDGMLPGRGSAGGDVRAGTVTVRAQRLYELISLSDAQQHRLSLAVPPGVSAYAFTFG